MDIFDTAQVLFVVGNAINDAGVAAWEAKIKFDSIRPLQMIQCGFSDELLDAWIGPYQGVGDVPAAVWQPYQAATFVTPAFAGYVSGHSTFSAAAAGALINIFGEAYVAPKCRRIAEGESLFEAKIERGQPGFMDGMTNVANRGPRTKGGLRSFSRPFCALRVQLCFFLSPDTPLTDHNVNTYHLSNVRVAVYCAVNGHLGNLS